MASQLIQSSQFTRKLIMKINTLLICFLFFQSCTILKYSERFKDFRNKGVGLNEKHVRMDGYYYCEETYDGSYFNDIKAISTLILYKNGIIDHRNTTAVDYVDNRPMLNNNSFEYVHKVFNSELRRYPYNNNIYSDWGLFRLNGDSIRIQFYVQALSPAWKYDLVEKKGTILNDTTFLLTRYIDYVEPQKNKNINELYKFRKLDAKPDSICWINEE